MDDYQSLLDAHKAALDAGDFKTASYYTELIRKYHEAKADVLAKIEYLNSLSPEEQERELRDLDDMVI